MGLVERNWKDLKDLKDLKIEWKRMESSGKREEIWNVGVDAGLENEVRTGR